METSRRPEPGALAACATHPEISREDFERLSAFIQGRSGIRMPWAKKTLVESRLGRRVQELGLSGFSEYCDHVLGGRSPEEVVHLIDRITTNKTEFFREEQHFDILLQQALPALGGQQGAGPRRELRLWSAGCSTGEEPYTLAMVLSEAEERDPGLRFRILATDLSTRVLRHAQAATYPDAVVQPIPLPLRRKYLQRSAANPDVIRMGKALRERVSFRQLNLLDEDYQFRGALDVIFCRNVFIYFDRRTQREILLRFAQNLVPGGFLFLGHSETINGLDVPFDTVALTVYRRRAGP